MLRLVWDAPGSRVFETGVDRVVLYPHSGPAVPWNGLTSIEESAEGLQMESYHFDGFQFYNEIIPGDFHGTIRAFTYPDILNQYLGSVDDGYVTYYNQNVKNTFGLSYRTLIGNDVEGEKLGYKIHILYNLSIKPSSTSYDTLGSSVNPSDFSWEITGVPKKFSGKRPTAHIVIDSRRVSPQYMDSLEGYLYGYGTTIIPRILTPSDIEAIVNDPRAPYKIEPNSDGIHDIRPGGMDLYESEVAGYYRRLNTSRLKSTGTPGIFNLEV